MKVTSKKSKPVKVAVIVAQLLFLFHFLGHGSYVPYLNLFYERQGLSGAQIGLLAALPTLCSITTTLIWSGIADSKGWHKQIMSAGFLVSIVAVFLLFKMTTMEGFVPVVVLYGLSQAPISPLLDSYSVEVAEKSKHSYGQMRLWGSIGWAVATVLVGWIIARRGINWIFYGFLFFTSVTFIISLFQFPRAKLLKTTVWTGLKTFLSNKVFLLFLFSSFLYASSSGGMMTFFSIYMDSIGSGEGLIGLAWALTALLEVPVMFYSSQLISRFGARKLVALGYVMMALSLFSFSVIKQPVIALLLMLLHGPSYASFLNGAIHFVSVYTPEGFATAALAIFSLLSYGLGSMLGSLIGGQIVDLWGLGMMFLVLGVITTVALVVFEIVIKRYTTHS